MVVDWWVVFIQMFRLSRLLCECVFEGIFTGLMVNVCVLLIEVASARLSFPETLKHQYFGV